MDKPIPEGVRAFRRDLTVFCEAIEDGADSALANKRLSDHEEGFHRGSRDAAKRIRRLMYDGTLTAAQHPTPRPQGEPKWCSCPPDRCNGQSPRSECRKAHALTNAAQPGETTQPDAPPHD